MFDLLGITTTLTTPFSSGRTILMQAVSQIVNFVVGQDSQTNISWPAALDANGNPVDLSAATLKFIAWTSDDGGDTKVTQFEYSSPTHIVVTGANNNVVNVYLQQGDTNIEPGSVNYTLVSVTNGPYVLASGVLAVAAAVMS